MIVIPVIPTTPPACVAVLAVARGRVPAFGAPPALAAIVCAAGRASTAIGDVPLVPFAPFVPFVPFVPLVPGAPSWAFTIERRSLILSGAPLVAVTTTFCQPAGSWPKV